jgi:hypothetical protein
MGRHGILRPECKAFGWRRFSVYTPGPGNVPLTPRNFISIFPSIISKILATNVSGLTGFTRYPSTPKE